MSKVAGKKPENRTVKKRAKIIFEEMKLSNK